MTAFIRFPRTPHLAWLGEGTARDDKVLTEREAEDLLARDLVVEEKLDGANVGVSVDEHAVLRVQNRGTYLVQGHCHPQFRPIFHWLSSRKRALIERLFPDLMIFGEWCYAVHSVYYTELPDWFVGFDVYDRSRSRFWSTERRDALLRELDIALMPRLGAGHFDLCGLKRLLGRSQFGDTLAEGLYLRADEEDWLAARAKLVEREFTRAIHRHWSRAALRRNEVAGRGAT